MDPEATARKQKHVAEEYLSSLSDLQCNSKPLINMLTMLAEENIDYAPIIVKVVEQHIAKVPTDLKLPILYLIDSIVKNVKSSYVALFGQCIVSIFCGVFEKVNEKVRERMYSLRLTWSEVFPPSKLYSLDVRVKQMDQNWPITAVKQQPTAIHVNPNFLKTVPNEMEELLQAKTRELLELKKRKLELELEATKKHIEEQQKQLSKTSDIGGDSNISASTSSQLPQILPAANATTTHVNPAILAGQTQMPTANASIYNQNFVRPPARMVIQPQKGSMPIVQQVHPGTAAAQHNLNKVKVNPVNPALLNSIRHRDPRLMRQQLQQKQIQQAMLQSDLPDNIVPDNSPIETNHPSTSIAVTDDSKRDRRVGSSKSSKSSRFNSGAEGSSKSPTRASSSHRSSKSSSSSSSSSSRNKDKERKRSNEIKSYSRSNERRYQKTGSSSSSNTNSSSKHTTVHKVDKDISETPTVITNKQNRSPTGSPTKFKDSSKRIQGVKTINNLSKNGVLRRSNSPDNIVSSTKDVDLREMPLTASPRSDSATTAKTVMDSNKKAAVKGLEQNIKKDLESMIVASTATKSPIIKDVDLRPFFPPGTIMKTETISRTSLNVPKNSLQNVVPVPVEVVQTATLVKCANLGAPVVVASSSSTKSPTTPKVSFKILKTFNKLAKSTETLSTATTTTKSQMIPIPTPSSSSPSSSSSSSAMAVTTLKNYTEDNNMKKTTKIVDLSEEMDIDEQFVSGNAIVDGKKRMSEPGVIDEPMAKKSKPTKIDALFGSEDVDLRKLAPPFMAKAATTNEVLAPPPPPIICSSDDEQQQEETKKRESKSSRMSTQNANNEKVPSNFEDVRAKLAKATRQNKLDKASEKVRQKLSELNANNDDETTQEAEDEKIRIILTQAQEMLESNSLNQSQYKQLVQTVMSMNEKHKLKEAKRRESLQQQNTTKTSKDVVTASPKDDDQDYIVSAEVSAARDAVLRKRIPKKAKAATNASTDAAEYNSQHARSPIGENDEVSSNVSSVFTLNKLKPKEKRVRHTKWGERNDSQANTMQSTQSQRPWIGGPAGKRPNSGMRTSNIPPPPQAPQPPMILTANAIRPPMHGGGVGWSQTGNAGQPNRPMHFGNQMPLIRSSVPPPPQPPMTIPPVLPALTPNGLPKPCNSIDNPQADLVRTITIDSQSKDIRIYDDVAIVFMELDEPREITFQPGQRAIIIDNQEPVTLRFNDEYRPLMIAGQQHNVRFGFPSRELYIDEHWYEIYFGGPPVSIPINNRIHILKAEGPPPQVNIGPIRQDLVVGKIHMIVEAVNLFPLFLDARIQMFRLDDREHTVQFADNLLTVLLDGQPVQVEYGGLPKSYNLNGKRYFIRFTTLPKGVVAGKVSIKDMIFIKSEPTKKTELPIPGCTSEEKSENMDIQQEDKTDENILPTTTEAIKSEDSSNLVPNLPSATTALGKINIDELFQKLVSSGILNNNLTAAAAAVIPTNAAQNENVIKPETTATTTTTEATKSEEISAETEEEKLPPIIPIDLQKSESIKTRQQAIISSLYSGMQCSSCGVRFPPEQTIKYSQHLDWHFRQNRRERDSTRKVHSRKWYYDLNDWLQYEEIEDLEEREKNFFEAQQNEMDALDDVSNQRSTNSPMPSCPAGPDDVDRLCDICQEKFEQFYNEELEEWHLRAALRVEDKIYHPLCYEDFKASLSSQAMPENDGQVKSNDEDVILQEDDNAMDVIIKIEEDEKGSEGEPPNSDIVIADDDDDVIVLPNEEPSVTEIDDDEEYVPINVTREEMTSGLQKDLENENKDESAMESDVEIQEPNIPFTDLDTYEEKELPIVDENSQASFLNVKIKEEPKDDDDEDDGFEDVGTVIYGPHDEISIQSSEETQTQTIISSTDSPLTIGGEHSSSANTFNQVQTDESPVPQAANELEQTTGVSEDSNHILIDGNIEAADGHNLSSAGPTPAVPLGSLVNRIKINITKNISSATTHSTSSSTAATTTATTTTTTIAATSAEAAAAEVTTTNSLNSNNSYSNTKSFNLNTRTNVVSTIPVLCAGITIPTPNLANNISNISVIGSYGNYHKPQHHHHHQQSVPVLATQKPTPVNTVVSTSVSTTTTATTTTRQRTPSPKAPAPVEETITYEQKPALQKANLKKMKKIERGVETSGLCSIM